MTSDWYDPALLPKFSSPPVAETVIALEYAPLPSVDGVTLVRLQDAWSNEYPQVSEANGAPPSGQPGQSEFAIQFGFGDVARRIWAAQPGSGLLLQSQNDRLILNWRRAYSTNSYPGYDFLKREYNSRWQQMVDKLTSLGAGSPLPHLGEFSYVNNVPLEEGETMSDVVNLITPDDGSLPGTDSFGAFEFVREVAQGPGAFPAQVQVIGQPLQTPEGRMLQFSVTVRVLLAGEPHRWSDGLDEAHALASRTFAAVITARKQEKWGRLS